MSFRDIKEKLVAYIDDTITKIDNFASTKKSSEVAMITLAIPLVILFLFYQFVMPIKEKEVARSKQEMVRVEREAKLYKDSGAEDVQAIEAQITNLRAQIEDKFIMKEYLESKMLELDNVYFTPKEWASLLGKMTTEAKETGIVITSNKNLIKDDSVGFAPLVEVDLVGHGAFLPIMKFLHRIESGSKMITIENLAVESAKQNQLDFNLSATFWEVK